MSGIKGIIKSFDKAMEAAAYAEEGDVKSAREVMLEGADTHKPSVKRTEGGYPGTLAVSEGK